MDIVAVLSANDPFVNSAWMKANKCADKIVALSDAGAAFSSSIGWSQDLSAVGLGVRTGRYAMIIGKDGMVDYAEKEPGREVSVSGADAVLSKL